MKRFTHSIVKNYVFVLTGAILMGLFSCNSEGQSSAKPETGIEESSRPDPPSIDIHGAAVMGDTKAIRQHIEAGTDLDLREPSMESTPMITAALFGRTEVVKLLIEGGADVNLRNKEGSTPLHTAAFFCRKEIVALLLEHGADKELKNMYGSTALESVQGPFEEVKPIYEGFNAALGPMGLKLDFDRLEKTRPVIAGMLE